MLETWLTEQFDIKYPIIQAPMFLITNEEMLLAASRAGIMGAIPALNFRTSRELRTGLRSIKEKISGPFGVNLVTNKSNLLLKQQIKICQEIEPAFIITALGDPSMVNEAFRGKSTKILCEVTNLKYANKAVSSGADALIALNSAAGGHRGTLPSSILVPSLKNEFKLPVISSGGVGTASALKSSIMLGAQGVCVGTIFISCTESPVSQAYKQACIEYGADDIVLTTKISGVPCTVIKTPYVEKIGVHQNPIEAYLNRHRRIKKISKIVTGVKGMNILKKSAFSTTYKTVWCAGPTIEFVSDVLTTEQIVQSLVL